MLDNSNMKVENIMDKIDQYMDNVNMGITVQNMDGELQR